MRRLLAILGVFIGAGIAGCGFEPGYPAAPITRPGNVLDFHALYTQNCAACHGRDGQNGPAISLANPEYQELIDDATLRKWIASGMPGTQMPAFAQSAGGMLTDAQVNAIVAGMRRQWVRPNAFAGAQPPSYPQDHAGDAQRGQQTYQARCAVCHKQEREEITSPVYLSLISDQALRSFIVAGSPGMGQPDWRHDSAGGLPAPPLSSQDVDDVVAYLAGIRNSAPGFSGSAAALPTPPNPVEHRSEVKH